MTLAEIRAMPTTLDTGPNSNRIHESCFRSYHIVKKAREMITAGASRKVLIEVIDDLIEAPQSDKTIL